MMRAAERLQTAEIADGTGRTVWIDDFIDQKRVLLLSMSSERRRSR